MDIQIHPISPDQSAEAKRLILSVANITYQWPMSLEEIISYFDERGELRDVDDPQAEYVDRQGLFLVALDQGHLIGTGAIRRYSDEVSELKRLWLLESYHGQGIGYRLVQLLLEFARGQGFKRVRLLTDRRQARAIQFYQRVGFQEIACESDDPQDLCMEIQI